MKIERIYQTKYLFINGNLQDKNKNVQNFLEYFTKNKYFLQHRITLIIANRDSNNNYTNIIDDTNYETQGVLTITNSTDELFEKLFKHAYAIVNNSYNEGLDLNLLKALKLGIPIYINPNHPFTKTKLDLLNIHKIDSNNPKYDFEVQHLDVQTDKVYDYFTKRDEPRSVSIKKLIDEIRDNKS
jgi:hypothetical protein